MTDLPAKEDLNLFRSFAGHETRRVLEALLEGGMRQKELAQTLRVRPQVIGQAVQRLEVAGLVARSSSRGSLHLVHYDSTAKMLELEAALVMEIQTDRAQRSSTRLRELRKRTMKGRARHETDISNG